MWCFGHIHLFYMYLLSRYAVAGTELDAENTIKNESDIVPSHKDIVVRGGRNVKKESKHCVAQTIKKS